MAPKSLMAQMRAKRQAASTAGAPQPTAAESTPAAAGNTTHDPPPTVIPADSAVTPVTLEPAADTPPPIPAPPPTPASTPAAATNGSTRKPSLMDKMRAKRQGVTDAPPADTTTIAAPPPTPTTPSAPAVAAPKPAPPAAAAAPAPHLAAPKPAPPAAAVGTGPPALTGSAALLARMRSRAAAPPTVTVLFASQTGTAEEVAKEVAAGAKEHGCTAKVAAFDEFGLQNISADKTPILIVIAATTGDGDAPDTSLKSFQAIQKPGSPSLYAGVNYSLLGLGDSNYTRFMAVPRVFRRRLADLGAHPFHPCAEADEVDGIEATIDVWVPALWEAVVALKQRDNPAAPPRKLDALAPAAPPAAVDPATLLTGLVPLSVPLGRVPALGEPQVDIVTVDPSLAARSTSPTPEEATWRDPEGLYSPERPFHARIAAARLLTAPDSDRRVIHLGVDLSGAGMAYRPGDAIGVAPHNHPDLVTALLARLEWEEDTAIDIVARDGSGARRLAHYAAPTTLRRALTEGADVTAPPRKSLLRVLAEHCTAPAEAHTLRFMCTPAGKPRYQQEVLAGRASLLDVLRSYPSCRPPVTALLEALPRLAPRLYSIAASPLEAPQEARVALSVVRYATAAGEARGGVASTWLDRLSGLSATGPAPPQAGVGAPLPVFLKRGGAFKPPAELGPAVIMVGPGTGVAPFLGFIQQRRHEGRAAHGLVGASYLFFGCRRREEDFLYREELEAAVGEQPGELTHLVTAFSREQDAKVYVQHKMREMGAELVAHILAGAYVYVCGDGAGMAQDVHAEVAAMLEQHAALTKAEAAAKLQEMAQSDRYVRDIWS